MPMRRLMAQDRASVVRAGIRGGAIGVRVEKRTRPDGGPHQQGRGLQQRGFAGAIGADQSDALAGRDGQRDAAQGEARAVAFVEVDEFEGHSAGRAPASEVPTRAELAGDGLEQPVARRRLASNQFAQNLFGAGALAGVILFGDGACLAAEFEAEELVLEAVEAVLHFALDGRHVDGRCGGRARCRTRRGSRCRWRGVRRRSGRRARRCQRRVRSRSRRARRPENQAICAWRAGRMARTARACRPHPPRCRERSPACARS